MISDLSPIFIVGAIEPQLPFYEQKPGFTRAMQVPDQSPFAFVGLERDNRMIMLRYAALFQTSLSKKSYNLGHFSRIRGDCSSQPHTQPGARSSNRPGDLIKAEIAIFNNTSESVHRHLMGSFVLEVKTRIHNPAR
jgi:hypothetical protein